MFRERYPALFSNDLEAPFDFEFGPGWFSIADTLFGSLSLDPNIRVIQAKSKYGSFRVHLNNPMFGLSAMGLGEIMSARVCEISGRPGRLFRYNTGNFATLAPDVDLPSRVGVPKVAVTSVKGPLEPASYHPPIAFALDEMIAVRGSVLTGSIEIPLGWYDLADVILQALQGEPEHPSIRRMYVADGKLQLDWDKPRDGLLAFSDMAVALSRRIDQNTGAHEMV